MVLFVLAPPRALAQATFSAAHPVETPPLLGLAVADLDGDGDPDLVAITANTLVWFENDGTGQFAPAQTLLAVLPSETRALKAADLDGDGDPDMLIGNDSLFEPGGLFWSANEGGQLSALEVIEPVDSGVFLTVDFDGDGDLDVLQGGLYVGLYENTGESGPRRFRRAHALAAGPARALAAADFDGDGDADLVASQLGFEGRNDVLKPYEQRGPGPFRFSFERELMPFAREEGVYKRLISVMETADINGDGQLDVVIGAYLDSDVGPVEGRLSWYRNRSFGTGPLFSFGGSVAYQESNVSDIWGPRALTVADFDGDGDADAAISKASHGPSSLVWYENPGDAAVPSVTWSEHDVDIITGNMNSSQAADIDLDGDVDLVTLVLTPEGGRLVWYENVGDTGTSTEEREGVGALVPESLKLEGVWPNPSSGIVTVAYQVRQAGRVRLEVFDVLGRLVATYEEHLGPGGSYQTNLDLSVLAAGTYVLRLKAGRDGEAIRRIVLQ